MKVTDEDVKRLAAAFNQFGLSVTWCLSVEGQEMRRIVEEIVEREIDKAEAQRGTAL